MYPAADMEGSSDMDVFDDEGEEAYVPTQSTQQDSQPPPSQPDEPEIKVWGLLQPLNNNMSNLELWKVHPEYRIGRHTTNTIVFPGLKISNHHCTITWDSIENSASSVIVRDYSSNGTYVNGRKIGKGQSRLLRDGNEIAFGTCVAQPDSDEDYRFIFRLVANGTPTEGLYAYYDVGNELGKGSFATVVKAICRRTGEWYAVKIVHDRPHKLKTEKEKEKEKENRTQMSEEGTVARPVASREISIMQKLIHPNICQLKEVFFFGTNGMHLVLEYVDGGDLLEYIIKNNGLCEVDAQHISYQVCSALKYIHERGIAHRDLKPENILLTSNNPPIVKIADFGLSKAVNSLTMLRTMCGTPSYLAPEVVKQVNEEGYDNLVDSWSVGVIVFSMLTNAAPFIEDLTLSDIRTRIAERRVDWSILHNADVSEEAEDFIRCLLKPDPHYRMSLSEALEHPWLTMHNPVYDISQPLPLPRRKRVRPSGNSAGLSPFELSTDDIPGITATTRQGSRLQRRSEVLARAEEENIPLLQPSDEMIANAEIYENASTEELYKGSGKRARSEMSGNFEGLGSIGDFKGRSREQSTDEDLNYGSRPRNKQARRA